MDATPLYVTNYFPSRSVFRASHGGAGHWQIARRGVQDKQFRTVVCSSSSEQKAATENGRVRHRTQSCRSNKMEDSVEHVLDTSLLVRTHHAKKPSHLTAADVSDRGLTPAQWEEFQKFTCLAYINASENSLNLEAFRTFPALRELDLSMNGIHRITIVPGEFPQLEVLDLSYNSLFPGDIRQLGVLPRLRVLCLSGNGLTHLPPDLSAPPMKDGDIPMFPSLEVIMLDDNLLSHPDVFHSLAALQRLKLLNLDKNNISAVPYLSGAVSSPSLRETVPGGVVEGRGDMTEGDMERSKEADYRVDYMVLHSTKDPDRTEVIFPSPRNLWSSDRALKSLNITIHPSTLPSPLLSPTESASPPLPSLRTLSLADNKICYEEDVLSVALLPSLEELIINGNPLITLRKGDPPLLGSFLQQRLRINVIHKKPLRFKKPHLIIPRKEKRKVTTHVPKIPKQPLMLESPLPCFLRLPHPESDITKTVMSSSPLPPIRTSSEGGMDTPPRSQKSEEEMSFSCDPGMESVFMTQVDAIPDSPAESLHIPQPRTTPEERDTVADKTTEPKKILEKFRGYEELYEVKTDPAFIEPVGIQNNVRALEYALRHLLVYRDYKPRLHSVQKLYRESKFGEIGPPPRKSKKDEVAEALTSMKEQRHLLEVPLDSVLQEGRSRKERKEAKLLLKELQKKYQLFHKEAVKRASEVEAGLQDTARQLIQAQSKAGDIHKRVTTGKS